MADPITIGIAGAAAGAMLDKDNPLRGAALGGLGGWGGASALGVGAAGSAAAQAVPGMAGTTAGAANNALYSGALSGISGSAPGSQAAMLAAQTADFGTLGLGATMDSAAFVNGGSAIGQGMMGGGLGSLGKNPMDAMSLMGAMGGQQQPQQRAPMAQAPQLSAGGGSFARPQEQDPRLVNTNSLGLLGGLGMSQLNPFSSRNFG